MKYLKQFMLILAFSLAGEGLRFLIPLPVPGSIYGMVLLFLALLSGVVKLSDVKETGHFLIDIMTVMFIPAGVALISSWDVVRPMLLPLALIILLTIPPVMAAAGRVSQRIIRSSKGGSVHE